MSVRGTPIFDAIAVVELKANMRSATFEATGAFINSARGTTHGWTTAKGQVWSRETVNLLKELVKSMEADMAKEHFFDGAAQTSTEPRGAEPGGISEFLGSEDPTPSV
jgi:hypothetical protein